MHFPTPHLKKTEKRKASVESVVVDNDHQTLERKSTRRGRKPKRTKSEKAEEKEERAISPWTVQGNEPTERASSPMTLASTSSQISPTSTRKDSAQEANPSPVPTSKDAPPTDSTTPEPQQPRRSSRIRNSMHSVANTWTKARPYVERLNGTIMPLHPQGTSAYYARDGVKVD
ncbi:hypothetical protein IQ06DRAFT_381634 [Phaeosphaeriaceae sp. SRC1lsM3a]|nr:hypothetical protein IQ06DRAFT_381634 [Stagonospora sp. SRC1lsM3a]